MAHRPDNDLTECKFCGRRIRFVRTVRSGGRSFMPIDPEPNGAGTFILDQRSWAYTDSEAHLTFYPDEDPSPDRYVPHQDTCLGQERPRPGYRADIDG
jgi:hypothetical protein